MLSKHVIWGSCYLKVWRALSRTGLDWIPDYLLKRRRPGGLLPPQWGGESTQWKRRRKDYDEKQKRKEKREQEVPEDVADWKKLRLGRPQDTTSGMTSSDQKAKKASPKTKTLTYVGGLRWVQKRIPLKNMNGKEPPRTDLRTSWKSSILSDHLYFRFSLF